MLIVLCGCGGNGGSGLGTTTALSVTPAATSVEFGRTVQLLAVPTGGLEPVQWSVTGPGTVSTSGLFTAGSATGTATVRVAVVRNPSIFATSIISVGPGVTVDVNSLGSKVVVPRSRIRLTATVAGTSNLNVTWSVPGGSASGTIASDGTYTAPNAAGTYLVTARSQADPTKTDDFSITVAANASVRFNMTGGATFTLALRPDKAPGHVANFVSLVNEGFYDGIVFHRREDLSPSNSIPDFIVQGGDPLTKTLPLTDPSIGTGGPGYTIPFETNDLVHDQYALAMARSSGMDTAGSQFYLCQNAVHFLDGNYVVFGSVSAGTAAVDNLRRGDVITSAVTQP